MQFMLIRTDNDTRAAATDPQAVLDDLLRRLPGGHAAADGPRAPALALAFAPDAEARRLTLSPGGGETVTSGPFPAGERLPAGFAVFEAPSRAAALAWLQANGVIAAGGDVTVELRETGCPGGCASIPPGVAGEDTCYAILLRSDAGTERDAIPLQEKLDRLNAFNAIHAAAGTLLAGDGLKSTARGARVRVANGGASIIDGPFAEAKELIAGFWMIRAPSIDAALDWARTLPYPTGPEVEVEIRPVALIAPLGRHAPVDTATARLREDASVRAEQLDAALRAELAPQPAWDRP
ncbi:YciI family protein [Telluria mixta]|uniref:YciI family protein n=1 Tax=Telluria mixta TaxID=34071 RepID=A0ABT2BTH0_9BURK|nr:YciI family protein [Telluria mixta]MCS0628341.1 YciI family protein [Telluria mixta]WEM93551.1 YciI family protein [Telluria mixta]